MRCSWIRLTRCWSREGQRHFFEEFRPSGINMRENRELFEAKLGLVVGLIGRQQQGF
jgi:hypothetical protein